MTGFSVKIAGGKWLYSNNSLGALDLPRAGWLDNFLDSQLVSHFTGIRFNGHNSEDKFGVDSEFLVLGR